LAQNYKLLNSVILHCHTLQFMRQYLH